MLTIEGKYQTKDELPFVPGNEVAGVIVAVGVGVWWGSWVGKFPEESTANFWELIEMIDSGKFEPMVSEVYPIESGKFGMSRHFTETLFSPLAANRLHSSGRLSQ